MACLMEIRRRMMGEQAFPPLYKKVDSVWSYRHGGQIDTGVVGSDNLKIQAVFMVNFFSAYAGFFGNYVNEASNCWRIILSSSDNGSIIATTNHKASGGGVSTQISDGYKNRTITALLDYNSVTFEVDGNTYTNSTSGKQLGDGNTTNICIGHSRVLPTASFNTTEKVTWYGFRIWQDDTLIRDYIPCLRLTDNKAGLYDMINHTFNPSIAKSEFFVD